MTQDQIFGIQELYRPVDRPAEIEYVRTAIEILVSSSNAYFPF